MSELSRATKHVGGARVGWRVIHARFCKATRMPDAQHRRTSVPIHNPHRSRPGSAPTASCLPTEAVQERDDAKFVPDISEYPRYSLLPLEAW